MVDWSFARICSPVESEASRSRVIAPENAKYTTPLSLPPVQLIDIFAP